jgi:outer membrane protein TolC
MRLRAVLFTLLVTSGVAQADLLTRALAQAGGGGGGSGGSGSAAPSPDDNLLAWAGPVQQTSLPDLLQIAVRQAPALLTAKLDISIAEAQIQQTWARHDWLFSARVEGSWSGSGAVAGITVGSSLQLAALADLTHTISTGGTLGLHVQSTYLNTETASMPPIESTFWTDDVAVSFAQPLLRGRGSDLFDAGERQAQLSRDAAVLGRRAAALSTVQEIVAAYWDLVLAQRQVAITEASLSLARERLRITEIGAQGGKIARAEIPAVQQIIATREEEVLGGELTVLQRSIALRRAVGMQIGAGELGLRVATELEAQDKGWTLGPLLERAYAASPELAQLEKQDASATIEIEVTENGLLPRLDLALSLGPTGTDTAFGGAAKNLVKFSELSAQGSLTFEQALNRDDVKGRSRELRYGREKIRVNAADVKQQIAQTMAVAVAQIELAKRRVVLSQRAIDLAIENIRIETDRFNLGKSTNFDVLNRLEEQRQAELRKAQAMIDWHKAESVVQSLTGDILPAYGIALE